MIEIRPCSDADRGEILAIVNEAAEAYRGIIPADRWHDPYMSAEELGREIAAGVRFSAAAEGVRILGVMGIQPVLDSDIIRHAYVRRACQGRGIGSALLRHLRERTARPVLIGTWAAATWAIRFYEREGFALVPPERARDLLRTYWDIPERQIETSVVLAERTPGGSGTEVVTNVTRVTVREPQNAANRGRSAGPREGGKAGAGGGLQVHPHNRT